MPVKGKIINDPVYGFLQFPEAEVFRVIEHPWFQRLRHIKQMGMSHLVYPGAVHTRLHHSLGACHLMGKALEVLKQKGVLLDREDCVAARLAILLHDVGHGPFSHALENSVVEGVSHEVFSMMMMQRMNEDMDGILTHAIQIFDHAYSKKYLHQLVSSQLDVDRMDYLNRDSFYTGVSEGIIGYDRILQMFTVINNELAVEEKGIHSVEKFIIARRLMYWQVYLHKTSLGAELLLGNILKRAKELVQAGGKIFTTPALKHFLSHQFNRQDFENDPRHLELFVTLDDADIFTAIKMWQSDNDEVLSVLSRMLVQRKLYKTLLSSQPLDEIYEEKCAIFRKANPRLSNDVLHYFVFKGKTQNRTYNIEDERIAIAMKNDMLKDVSEVDNALVTQALARPVHKNYICFTLPNYNIS
ncbi:MAG TPA: HD domain-containing protein [Flavipsychrobacter sp.]|nr:HD domain-containing protein [Flavipsychrobacter sp.]